MFVFNPRLERVFRIILIATILFNALIPTIFTQAKNTSELGTSSDLAGSNSRFTRTFASTASTSVNRSNMGNRETFAFPDKRVSGFRVLADEDVRKAQLQFVKTMSQIDPEMDFGEQFSKAFTELTGDEPTLQSDQSLFKTFEPAPNPTRHISGSSQTGVASDSFTQTANLGRVFTVTTLADTDDGKCDNNCSLREAIYAANRLAGADTITFNISGTILLESRLPYILDPAGLTISDQAQRVKIRGGSSIGGENTTSSSLSAPEVMESDLECPIYSEGPLTLSGTYTDCPVYSVGALTVSSGAFTRSPIASESTITISASTFADSSVSGNSTMSMTGTDFTGSGSIYSEGSLAIAGGSFARTSISSNSTLSITDGNYSGTPIASAGAMDISGGTFNASSNAAALLYSGGTLTITDSTFTGTSIASFGEMGISLSNFSDSTTSVSAIASGDVLTITNSTFRGTAIASVGTMNIGFSSFSDSTTSGSAIASGDVLTSNNGVFIRSNVNSVGRTTIITDDVLTIANSTFIGNASTNQLTFGSPTFYGVVPVNGAAQLFSNSAIVGSFFYSDVELTISSEGILTSTNDTFSGARIDSTSSLQLFNTILANDSECGRTASGKNNLIEATGTSACGLTNGVNGNLVGIPAKLGVLTGSPQYFELQNDSPAIGAGDNAVCADEPIKNTSQNGVTRPIGTRCEIGSYEALYPVINLISIQNIPGPVKFPLIQATIETDGAISNVSCSVECGGDPINTLTGVFSFTLADMSFHTSAGDLVFQRSYSSDALYGAGALGYGWTYNHDAKLIFPTDPGGMDDQILFQSVLGNQYPFRIEDDGSFSAEPGILATLTESSGPTVYTLTDSQQALFQFNEAGKLLFRRDAQGHQLNYDYDPDGKLTKVSADNETRFIQIEYDAQGRIETVRNHASQEVAFGYDAAGDLVSATDVLGQVWTYGYDSSHHMTWSKDPAGKETVRTEYDEEGRAVRQYDGEANLIVSITYNSDSSTLVYDALNNFEEHQYNAQHVAVETVDQVGRAETKVIDDNFRPTEISNSAGQTLQMTWSADGINLLSKTDPAGNITDYTYDTLNNLTSVKDARNFTTTYTYDGKLLTSSKDPLNGETTYTYTPEGYLVSVTDPAHRVTSYTYDSYGQRLTMTDPNGNKWHYSYDNLGHVIDTTDPRNRVTHNEYNDAGKLIRVTQNYDPNHIQNYLNQYNIVTKYEYDVRGNQTAVTDTSDHTTHYVYDDADQLLHTIDPDGNSTTNTYDVAGRLVSTKDPRLNETTYDYDAAGRLIKTINALGYHSGITTFDVATNTSSVTDILGRQTVFHYDDLGRVIKVVDPTGHFTTTAYDGNGNVATRTDQLTRTTHYEYDALNRLVRTINPDGGVTETFYDDAGNRIATEDALDHRTSYTYDDAGRLMATTDPLNRVTQTEYDTYGRRSVTVDAAGHRTTYTYDLLDRVITVTDATAHATHTTYDALGNVLTQTDANGHITTTTYDVLNRPKTITDANGRTTTNIYDEAGNLVTVTDALQHTTHYTYDALNRQKTVSDPLGNTKESVYDSFGNLLESIDANGAVTHYEYDALNRQKAVILNYKPGGPADAQTNVRYEFTYNEVGNRISVKDPNGNSTIYEYDALNRVTKKIDPLENTWTYTYDLAGNRISATDAKNQTIHYTYDDAGQLTNIDYPGNEPDISFTYTLTGQRLTMTDGLGTTRWTYDNLDHPLSIQDPFNKTIGYDYDAAGNRTDLTYPDGKTVSYTYDNVNHLTNVEDWDSQHTQYSYTDVGQLFSVTRPNGISSQYTYDAAGRLTDLQHKLGSNTLASYNYTYDPAGNRTRAIESLVNPIVPPTKTPTATFTDTPTRAHI